MLRPNLLAIRIFCGALIGLALPSSVQAQTADPLLLARWRKTSEFAYIRQYFPARKIDFEEKSQMTKKELKSSKLALSKILSQRLSLVRSRLEGIKSLIGQQGVVTPQNIPLDVSLELIDDGQLWLHNVPPNEVKVSPRVLRGLMRGSLQALRVTLPSDGNPWAEGSRQTFFGSEILGEDSKNLSDEEWSQRFTRMLTVIEKSKIRSMVGTVWRMMTSDDFDDDDDGFDYSDSDEYISGEKKMSLMTAMELGSAMIEFSKHYSAAENFLLAHELGHLILNNNPTDMMSCDQRKKAEDDADTVAIALMTMDDAAGAQVIALENLAESWAALGGSLDPRGAFGLDQDDYSVVYGYRDFTDFIYKAAEFGGSLGTVNGQACEYRTPSDRRAFIDGMRVTFHDRRKAALLALQNYAQEHPAKLSIQVSGSEAADKEDIYKSLEAEKRCAGVSQQRGAKRVTMKGLSNEDDVRGTEYFIRCKYPVPQSTILSTDQYALIGPDIWTKFQKNYSD